MLACWRAADAAVAAPQQSASRSALPAAPPSRPQQAHSPAGRCNRVIPTVRRWCAGSWAWGRAAHRSTARGLARGQVGAAPSSVSRMQLLAFCTRCTVRAANHGKPAPPLQNQRRNEPTTLVQACPFTWMMSGVWATRPGWRTALPCPGASTSATTARTCPCAASEKCTAQRQRAPCRQGCDTAAAAQALLAPDYCTLTYSAIHSLLNLFVNRIATTACGPPAGRQ